MPTTLQDLRKAKFSTIKSFAIAYGISPGIASSILKGKHHMVLNKEQIQRLADIFEVSFAECVEAADKSFWEYHPEMRTAYWNLEARWARQERIYEDTRNWWKRGHNGPVFPYSPLFDDTFEPLGLTPSATENEIKTAFRNKVKALSDGQGGYNGDMDALVQAKEKALAYTRGQK